MTRSLPRGIRNHNPLNIRISDANKWQGKLPRESNTDGAFEQFGDPIMGLRAGAVLLVNHYERRDADTLRKLIPIWAPATENDVDAYVNVVATRMGVHPDQRLDLTNPDTMRGLLEAMVRHENGVQPYTQAQFDAAMLRAGLELKQQPLRKAPDVQGAQVVGVGTAGVAAVQGVQEIAPSAPVAQDAAPAAIAEAQGQLSVLAPFLDVAKWLLLALVLIGLVWVLLARVDDRRKGLR